MTDVLAVVTQLAAALALLVAAAAKVAAPQAARATIGALGLPAPTALHALLVAAESTAAIALVAAPDAIATRVLVLGLGTAFAGAGLIALRRPAAISCACFGAGDGHLLGWRQLVSLPVWVVVAVVPASSPLSGSDGLLALSTAAVASGTLLATRIVRTATGLRPAPTAAPA